MMYLGLDHKGFLNVSDVAHVRVDSAWSSFVELLVITKNSLSSNRAFEAIHTLVKVSISSMKIE